MEKTLGRETEMIVKELIDILSKIDPELPIVVQGLKHAEDPFLEHVKELNPEIPTYFNREFILIDGTGENK